VVPQFEEILTDISESPVLIPTIAIVMRRMFTELTHVGFTEEQAFELLKNFKAK
jgi:hypothetical protein